MAKHRSSESDTGSAGDLPQLIGGSTSWSKYQNVGLDKNFIRNREGISTALAWIFSLSSSIAIAVALDSDRSALQFWCGKEFSIAVVISCVFLTLLYATFTLRLYLLCRQIRREIQLMVIVIATIFAILTSILPCIVGYGLAGMGWGVAAKYPLIVAVIFALVESLALAWMIVLMGRNLLYSPNQPQELPGVFSAGGDHAYVVVGPALASAGLSAKSPVYRVC